MKLSPRHPFGLVVTPTKLSIVTSQSDRQTHSLEFIKDLNFRCEKSEGPVMFQSFRSRQTTTDKTSTSASGGGGGPLEFLKLKAEGLWGRTKMETELFEFDWIVDGFFALQASSDKIVSPSFKGPKGQWHLARNMQVVDGKNVEYVVLFLYQTEVIPSTEKLIARVQLSLRDAKGGLGYQTRTQKAIDFQIQPNWGWYKFIPCADLTATECPWLTDDTLRIKCSIWIDGEVETESGKGPHPQQRQQNNKDKTLEDFGSLLRDGPFADVTLVTKTKTFKVHKAILAARSKVFAAMFASPMTEAASGSVDIPDFDENPVEGMLQYMYQGQVDELAEKARSLLQIAEKYDLQGLKEECEVQITNSLIVETAADDLVRAHMFNATIVKPRVIQFIMRHKEAVKKTEGFQNVLKRHSSLLLELLFDMQ